MKNWSTTKKIVVAIILIVIIAAIYMNWNKISSLRNKPSTRQYRAGGEVGRTPVGPIVPIERPGSILINPIGAPNGCTTALEWCTKEYNQTGNTNGYYCKTWKAGCLGVK